MRICFFAKPDAPQTRRLVAGMADRGAHVDVVYHGPGDVPGARYTRFAIPSRSLRTPGRWADRKRRYLLSFVHDYDVISIQFLHSWGFTSEMMAAGCFTVRPWGSDICPPPDGLQPRPDTVARRVAMIRNARSVAVTCATFRDQVARFANVPAGTIECLPLGVDLERFRPVMPRVEQPVVGFFKGFGHAYGAPVLIQALPRIAAAVPDVRFDLVGDGPTKTACMQLADRLGVAARVRWLPRIPHEQVPQTIGPWSLTVIPSLRESFCIAALEAAAMQLPVVASRVGGLHETVQDGKTGILTPPGDAAALADAVIALLRDRDRRIAMGRAGRIFAADRYDERTCLDRWYAYYERMAAACPMPV